MSRATRLMLCTLLMVAAVGCGRSRRPPPVSNQPVPLGADIYRIAPGVGVSIAPGIAAGYGITANQQGSFRLVWTGDTESSQTYREFSGVISTEGTFLEYAPGCFDGSCPVESEDLFYDPEQVGSGEAIAFNALTASGVDGIDFTPSQLPVYFDLYIDGIRYPDLVVFADAENDAVESIPASVPFGLDIF